MADKCPTCGEEFYVVGKHIHSCGYPKLSDKKKDILKGCLMGDASIDRRDGDNNARWTLYNTNHDYLKYVEDKLGVLASTRMKEDKEFLPQKTTYATGMTHPWLENLAGWYSTGEKVFPESIELTPTVLKHWYCCDGNTDVSERFCITVENEKNNKDKLINYFNERGFHIDKRANKIYANKELAKEIFNYMGSPPDGMSYKWPNS